MTTLCYCTVGGVKLNVKVCHIVLEQDGTQVDEDEVLLAVQSETLMLLGTEERWEPLQKPFESSNSESSSPKSSNSCEQTSHTSLEKTVPIEESLNLSPG